MPEGPKKIKEIVNRRREEAKASTRKGWTTNRKKVVLPKRVVKRLEEARNRETTLNVWEAVANPKKSTSQRTLDNVLQAVNHELSNPHSLIARNKLFELVTKLKAKGAKEKSTQLSGNRTGGQAWASPKTDRVRDHDTRERQKQAGRREANTIEQEPGEPFWKEGREPEDAMTTEEYNRINETPAERRERELDEMAEQARVERETLLARRPSELNILLGRYRELAIQKGFGRDIKKLGEMTDFFRRLYEKDPVKARAMMIRVLELRKPELILPGPEANPNAEIVRVNGGGKGPRVPTSPEVERKDYPLVKARSSELAVRPKEERRDSLDSLEGVPEEAVDRAVRGEPGAELELLRRVKEIQSVIGPEAFKDLVTRIANQAVENGNAVLFENIKRLFGPSVREIKRIEGKLDAVLREQRKNATENRNAHNELKDLLNKLIASNSDPEVKRLLEELSNALLDPATGEFRAIRADLNQIIKNLDNLSNMIADRGEFGEFIKEMCTLAFKGEQRNFIVAMVQRFEEEFPMLKNMRARFDYIDQIMRDMVIKDKKDMKEIKEKLLELSDKLDKIDSYQRAGFENILNAIEELKNSMSATDFTHIEKFIANTLLPKIREEIWNANEEQYKWLVQKLGNKYTNLTNLITKYHNQEEKRFREIKNLLDGLKDQSDENKEDVLNRLWDVFQGLKSKGTVDKDEILAKIAELQDYFTDPTKFKDTILKTALEEHDDVLIDKMKTAGLATKDDVEAAKKEILEEMKKITPGAPGEPGKDGDKGGKGGDTSKLEERLKKLEEKKPSIWRGLGYMGGGTLFLAILGLIALGLYKASQISHPSNASPIPIVPVVGGTAKVATSSSILGSLGGINPIIIVLVLVALFLLFPKK